MKSLVDRFAFWPPGGVRCLGALVLWGALAACDPAVSPALVASGPERDSGSPDGGGSAEVETPCIPGAAPAPLQLLTRRELDHTLRDLLGETEALAQAMLPGENIALGFDNNAEAHQVSPLLVEAMLELSERAAERLLADRPARLHPCVPALLDPDAPPSAAQVDACRDALLSEFVPRAWRRPAASLDLAPLRAAFDTLRGTPRDALLTLVQSVLMAPRFWYRVREVGADEAALAEVPLDAYEVAERLSYLLWRSMPDDALFAAAASGRLASGEGVLAEVQRMLRDPRARDMSHDFHRQWLKLDAFRTLRRDLPADHAADMAQVSGALVDSLLSFTDDALFGEGGGVDALLSSSRVWLSEPIAALYGEPGASGPLDLPPEERAGLLTQPGLLTLLAHAEQSSPIHRGIFVRERLLCEHLPPPPPGLVITPPSPDPSATTRERFAAHTEEESCQNCHVLIDPIGFGFEEYDALGRFRTHEHGLPINASGELLHTWYGDERVEGAFLGAVELAHRLADAPQVRDCIATQWWRYSFARGEAGDLDACSVEHARSRLRETGDVRELLRTLATSPAFLLRPALPLPPPREPPEPMRAPLPAAEEVASGAAGPEDANPPGAEAAGDPVPQSPIGFLDHVDAHGVARGWALDPNAPFVALELHVYLGGPAGEGALMPPAQRADMPRPDVNAVTGYPGDHGFAFALPPAFLDGQPHELYLYALDAGDDPPTLLFPSPQTVQVSP